MARSDRYGLPRHVVEAQRFVTVRYGRRASQLRLLGAGEWSLAYALALDGQPAVIRFGRHGADFLKDQVMAAYSSAELPVPAIWETGPTSDGSFAVSDRAPGRLLNDLDGASVRRPGSVFAKLGISSRSQLDRALPSEHTAVTATPRHPWDPMGW